MFGQRRGMCMRGLEMFKVWASAEHGMYLSLDTSLNVSDVWFLLQNSEMKRHPHCGEVVITVCLGVIVLSSHPVPKQLPVLLFIQALFSAVVDRSFSELSLRLTHMHAWTNVATTRE